MVLVSGAQHRYRQQDDQHIDKQQSPLPRNIRWVVGYPVGVFVAERARVQSLVARGFNALAKLVFKSEPALRILPFLVRQNVHIDSAVTENRLG